MDDLLSLAGIGEPCNVCGQQYVLTLREVRLQQQAAGEWDRVRPSCDACKVQNDRLADIVPDAELAALDNAWQGLAQALEQRGLQLTRPV